jgi:hypothetical protein
MVDDGIVLGPGHHFTEKSKEVMLAPRSCQWCPLYPPFIVRLPPKSKDAHDDQTL